MIVRNLSVRLGRREVLSGIDLIARAGEVTAIIGPNGSGKTTLMRAITGELPSSGELSLNGRDIRSAPTRLMATMRAVLAQSTPLSFPFTVAEIVGLGAEAGGETNARPVIGRALERVDLAGYGARLFQQLSGGEQQRVHLARVLAQAGSATGPDGPRWLLLDEPVSSLDIGHQLMVMRLARAFASEGGGVVAVLHDLNLTAAHVDHVLLLQCGRVAASGAPAEVLTAPRLSVVYGCDLQVISLPPRGMMVTPMPEAV
nr:heme ABC transporter ATP-binding protein [Paracoccus sp. Z118]